MSEAQDKAKKKYEAKRIKMAVSLNPETDQDLIEFFKSVDFSNWVKDQGRLAIISKESH